MTITERDKKILVAIVPLLLLAVYWFLLLAPKREEAAKVADALAQARDERDQAVQQAQQLAAARNSFAADYQVVVRLGKAIPDSVDMPSLIVQIDRAARGAHVKFDSITPGERGAATLPAP
ncbi:MAG: type 4a pilus biogenesis protein PilO, partial [Thermoleophilaceae bacterium]|nr:type 4a pilus biogenesis protein PilO [Thermoleophilaceae bacterium]